VPIGDRVAVQERFEQTLVASGSAARVMHEPDAQASRVHDEPAGKRGPQLGLVHVPVHRGDRGERAQLLEDGRSRQIADVEDEVGALEQADALTRETTRASREMRVADEGDQRNSGRKAPSR
jgi:hypothetical protein